MRLGARTVFLAIVVDIALCGYTIVHNQCDFDVWITSVGVTQGTTKKLSPDQYWNERQYQESPDVGTAVKITRTQTGLYEDKPILHLSYSVEKDKSIYYDLSTHNGFDFAGKRLRVHGQSKDVKEIIWDGVPEPNYTLEFNGDTDLTLELCDG